MSLNLLTEPIISVVTKPAEPTVKVNLPEFMALVATDQVDNLPEIRWHQVSAWQCLVVQLATIALLQQEMREMPQDEATWRSLLTGLTQDDEPWHLIQPDLSQPAFLQPPGDTPDLISTSRKHNQLDTPDDLDPIFSSKLHDVKPGQDRIGQPERWLYALVNRNTGAGYLGKSLYGISRMASGTSGRPTFSLSPSPRFSAHTRREIETLLLNAPHPARSDRPLLTWVLPWHGTKDEILSPEDLGPHYIDTASRNRLIETPAGIVAKYVTTDAPRISVGGDPNDPWAPLRTNDNKPITIPLGGLPWYRMAHYLSSSDFTWPLFMRPNPREVEDPAPAYLIARALQRSKGKTDGYFSATIRLNQETMADLGQPEGVQRFRENVAHWIQLTNRTIHALTRTLNDAGCPEGHVRRCRNQLDRWITDRFWERLQSVADEDWQEELSQEITELAHTATPTMPRTGHPKIHTQQELYDKLEEALAKAAGSNGAEPEEESTVVPGK